MTQYFTRRGDCGSTCSCTSCVSKSSAFVRAEGALDELNCFLGFARAECSDKKLAAALETLQRDLFVAGADLVIPLEEKKAKRVTNAHVVKLEKLVRDFSKGVPKPKNFVVPGGCKCAAALHVARAVCRRAESEAVSVLEEQGLNPQLIAFLNRLSSVLFVFSLYANARLGVREKIVPRLSR